MDADFQLEPLLARINAAFPSVAFEQARLSPVGQDNAVVILDEAIAFRFPRSDEQLAWLPAEMSLLAALQGRSLVATPHYSYVASDGTFGGYRLIQGEEMRLSAFKAAPRRDQEGVLDGLAGLLRALHDLPLSLLRRADGVTRTNATWAADAAERYAKRFRGPLEPHVDPSLLSRLDRFHTAYGDRAWPSEAIIHADIREAHLLIGPDGARLNGVIDFGDAAFGDPAYDLTMLWMLGDWAPAFVLDRRGGGDEALLERSRWSYLRYATGRLILAIRGDERYVASDLVADLNRHLDAIEPDLT